MQESDIAVIIVGWNVKDLVLENIASLVQCTGTVTKEMILVDNASKDGTVEAVRQAYPSVKVIANNENRGFAKACNQGIAASQARHILLLNPDMRVEPDALQKTMEYLDAHPDVAVVGAKLIGQDGKSLPHMRRFPTWRDQAVIVFKLQKLFPGVLRHYLGLELDLDREQDADSVRGAYFAINRTALERIGVLDERYFIWFEEVDYCRQVHKAGMRVRYVPSIVAHDLVGRSFAQRGSWWKRKQFLKSMLTYFWKWKFA
jgi:hypothetical protein